MIVNMLLGPKRLDQITILVVCFLICAPLFILNLIVPLGIEIDVLYIIPVSIAALLGRMKYLLFLLCLTITILLILRLIVSQHGEDSVDLLNVGLTILALNFIAILGQLYINRASVLEALNRSLERNEQRLEIALTELNARSEQLVRSNNDLQQFAYIASHDLKEPLSVVIGYLSLLQERYEEDSDLRSKTIIISAVENAGRMNELIDGLLDLSRSEDRPGKMELTDMNKVLLAAEHNLGRRIEESGAEIVHDPLPTIMADPSQMTELLQNLLANAIKYGRPGEVPRAGLTWVTDGDEIVFSLQDNGIGIPRDQQEWIFEMFHRGHGKDRTGTGIGLAIAKKIVERHGGRIWVESDGNNGSTFRFSLPATRMVRISQSSF